MLLIELRDAVDAFTCLLDRDVFELLHPSQEFTKLLITGLLDVESRAFRTTRELHNALVTGKKHHDNCQNIHVGICTCTVRGRNVQ